MTQYHSDNSRRDRTALRVGIFGATRAGKTVYLTSLYWLGQKGRLPPGVHGLRPVGAESAEYLGQRFAQLEAGRWPMGNVDSHPITLELDVGNKTLTLATNDFRGGDFTSAFYSSDPEEKQRAERFVRELFAGCSAYLFLVDCGDLRAAEDGGLEQQATAAQRRGAIETTLSLLRRSAWGFRTLHHPVAIVFTKCDLAPECAADPAAFAQQHLRATCDYLRRHAPGRHQFFAVSSTGATPVDPSVPPRPLSPTANFVEPVLWCARQHVARRRTLRWAAAAVLLVALVAGWVVLRGYNAERLAAVAGEVPQASDTRLGQLYEQVQGWRGWSAFTLTHPWAAAQLQRNIVDEAERRVADSLSRRLDGAGHLRSVDDAAEAEQAVGQFVKAFPHTENAKRRDDWIRLERQEAGRRMVAQLAAAAAEGNERRFDELTDRYRKVATAELDIRVEEARGALGRQMSLARARALSQTLSSDPGNIERIRELCTDAETTLRAHPHAKEVDEFVQLVRQTYDRLNERRTAAVSFRIETPSGDKIHWWYEVDGDDRAKSDDWRVPVRLTDGGYEIPGAETEIDLIATRTIRVAFNVNDWALIPRWYRSKLSTAAYSPAELCTHLQRPVVLTSNTNREYRVLFTASPEFEEHYRSMARIKELADELFRSAT